MAPGPPPCNPPADNDRLAIQIHANAVDAVGHLNNHLLGKIDASLLIHTPQCSVWDRRGGGGGGDVSPSRGGKVRYVYIFFPARYHTRGNFVY